MFYLHFVLFAWNCYSSYPRHTGSCSSCMSHSLSHLFLPRVASARPGESLCAALAGLLSGVFTGALLSISTVASVAAVLAIPIRLPLCFLHSVLSILASCSIPCLHVPCSCFCLCLCLSILLCSSSCPVFSISFHSSGYFFAKALSRLKLLCH